LLEAALRRLFVPRCTAVRHAGGMSNSTPTLTPRQLGFFSDWKVLVVWPNGLKQQINGFTSEAHAQGWITHNSSDWILANTPRDLSEPGQAPAPAATLPTSPTDSAGVALGALALQFEQASQSYAEANGVRRDADWFVLKLQEELGELTQVWMKLTGRGRLRGKTEAELTEALADETADLLGHILLFAHARGIDLDAAIERKWRFNPRS
jgi:NTP pyrophosphatase (non-canonical NTP hydrolase)